MSLSRWQKLTANRTANVICSAADRLETSWAWLICGLGGRKRGRPLHAGPLTDHAQSRHTAMHVGHATILDRHIAACRRVPMAIEVGEAAGKMTNLFLRRVSRFRSSPYCRYRVCSDLRNQSDTRINSLTVSLRF